MNNISLHSKCQKYGHNTKVFRGRLTFTKCSEKDLDHLEEEWPNEKKCQDCRQDHQAYSRSCDIDKKRKGNITSKAHEEYKLTGYKIKIKQLSQLSKTVELPFIFKSIKFIVFTNKNLILIFNTTIIVVK